MSIILTNKFNLKHLIKNIYIYQKYDDEKKRATKKNMHGYGITTTFCCFCWLILLLLF